MTKNPSLPNTGRIYLTGFMGSGKSTLGKILAGIPKRGFADLDEVIAREACMSIPEIFRDSGEEGFREMERLTAARPATGQRVAALGGGGLVNPGTRDLLISAGMLVYPRARPSTPADHLSGRRSDRPLIAGDEPPEAKVPFLLEAGSPVYSLAQWTPDTDDLKPEQAEVRIYGKIRDAADVPIH